MKKFLLIFFVLIFSCKQKWSYEGETSPQHWGDLGGELTEKYKFCKIGYNQSPINIEGEFSKSDLKFFYKSSEVEKERMNYVQNILFFDRNFLKRGRRKYWLHGISFHHPSEHLVKGKAHSLEMHLYHKSRDEQKLMVAVFLELGEENPDFKDLIKFLASEEIEGEINPNHFVKENDKSFFYDGSLTIPPCEEGVKWYVMETTITLSKDQLNKIIKSAIFTKSNTRPTQPYHPERF